MNSKREESFWNSAENMRDSHREPIPVSELVVGMKCGGSDGLVRYHSEPTVGRFSDMMAAREDQPS